MLTERDLACAIEAGFAAGDANCKAFALLICVNDVPPRLVGPFDNPIEPMEWSDTFVEQLLALDKTCTRDDIRTAVMALHSIDGSD